MLAHIYMTIIIHFNHYNDKYSCFKSGKLSAYSEKEWLCLVYRDANSCVKLVY